MMPKAGYDAQSGKETPKGKCQRTCANPSESGAFR